jgi:hypothetical protein
MFGLFGKKNSDGTDSLPGHLNIPNPVDQQLLVIHKEEPDCAWPLKSAMRPDGAAKEVF